MRIPMYRLFRPKSAIVLTFSFTSVYFVWSLIAINTQLKPIEGKDKNEYEIITEASDKIDWHNYEFINYEGTRTGIGERGVTASLNDIESSMKDELYSVNGFNGALSDRISLNRSLPDIRHYACRVRKYKASLPTVSVVVPVHNEHLSTLLRTVHSVVNRSPPSLLKEILLVDDASTKVFLKAQLEEYLKDHVPIARVLRLKARSGLIKARLVGAEAATGDVLVFLDSHTEANVNWLPPLLEPIAENYRTAVCPFIDVVDFETFEYRAQDEGARGAFDWNFFYKRLPVLPSDLFKMPDPFASPVMAGGLFAISRKFFWELGGYDEGLDIWGGEQYELSFKIWQCGGRMLDAPCSRVGHIYRKYAPFPNPGHGDFVAKNYRRVAEVWMDEYAQYLYKRRPHYISVDPGNLDKQRAIRTMLKCKSFHWFITQVAFDLTNKYPLVEPPPFAEGKIHSETEPKYCIDMRNAAEKESITMAKCDEGLETELELSWHKDVRSKRRNMCWDVPESNPHSPILLYSCHLGGGNQMWRYHESTKELKSGPYDVTCLDYDPSTRKVFVNQCAPEIQTQRWIIDRIDREALSNWTRMREQITGPTVTVNE